MTVARYTDGNYLEANPTWHEEDSPWKAEQIAGIVRDNQLAPTSVCEVGCGAGEILASLRNMLPGARFVGYDIASQAIARCAPKSSSDLSFVAGDFLKAKTETFDLLLLIDVFEHVDDYLGFLRALRSRARRFVFHIPLDLHVSSLVRVHPLAEARAKIGHLHYFTRETALATLVEAGYRIVDERYTPGGLELHRPALRARVARLPRRLVYWLNPHAAARWLGGFSLLVLAESDGTVSKGST
jgi:hypothetical protein